MSKIRLKERGGGLLGKRKDILGGERKLEENNGRWRRSLCMIYIHEETMNKNPFFSTMIMCYKNVKCNELLRANEKAHSH